MKKKILIITLILVAVFIAISIEDSNNPIIERSKCVGCGDCVEVCPVDAIAISGGKAVIDIRACINCGKCYRACTYNAIRAPNE